jgi:hypothetical protein
MEINKRRLKEIRQKEAKRREEERQRNESRSERYAHELIFAASNDKGKTFHSQITLGSKMHEYSIHPQIAAAGENVYVTGKDDSNIFLTSSKDNGKIFGSMVELNSNGKSDELQIAAVGNNVYVIWLRKLPTRQEAARQRDQYEQQRQTKQKERRRPQAKRLDEKSSTQKELKPGEIPEAVRID